MHTTHSPLADRTGTPAEGAGDAMVNEDPIEREAATWAVRRNAGLDAEGRARLQAWLAADPRHAPALAALSATLQGVRHMPAEAAARLRAGLPQRPAPRRPAPRRPAPRRPAPRRTMPWLAGLRPFLPHAAAAMVALAVLGTGWFGWWLQPSFEQTYATVRGQQMRVTLPDDAATGSTLQLDTATQLQARLFRDRREVQLGDGQAMFAVHADPARPFLVLAGPLRVTVVGTRFSIRHTASGVDAGRTVVAVEEGTVRVQRMADATQAQQPPAPEVVLGAGQMLAMGGPDDPDLGTVSNIAPQAVAQWRSGRISFNQTPLAQALAEFERYGTTGLVVHDPAVAAMTVGGSYDQRQHRRFAEFLPQLLPVRLVQRDGVTEIVAR